MPELAARGLQILVGYRAGTADLAGEVLALVSSCAGGNVP